MDNGVCMKCDDKRSPQVSVIIPIYNVEPYLRKCVDSVCGQIFKDIEIILVDDGSTDGSGKICDEYARKDERVRVIHKENGGLVSARKAGLAASHGQYISNVDGDDWIEEELLQSLSEYMERKIDVIAFAAVEEYGDGSKGGLKKNTVEEGCYVKDADKNRLYGQMMVNGNFYENGVLPFLCAKLFKRELLTECQMKVPNLVSYAEDAACTYPCLLKADSICVTNKFLYHYLIRPGSMVKGEIEIERLYALFDTLYHAFAGHSLEAVLIRQLQYSMWHAMLLKSYSRIEHDIALYPFPRVKSGMRVAVYGAGIFGKVIENVCEKAEDISVVGWFDRRYDFYARQGLAVEPGDKVEDTDFDMVVIAILNVSLAKQIKEDFVRRGIDETRIDYISLEVLESMRLPQEWECMLERSEI